MPNPEYFLFGILIGVTLMGMLIGLAGVILPVVPGLPLIWGASLVYGLIAGWGKIGPYIMLINTLLWLLGIYSSVFMGHNNAKQAGASWQATLASIILGVVGFFVIPVLGFFVGAVLGIFLVEYYQKRDHKLAWKSTKGMIVGQILGAFVEFSVGFHMIVFWALWVLVDGFILRTNGIAPIAF